MDKRGRLVSLVYAYYDNPEMYLRQVEEWDAYPEDAKRKVSIYVTDDCSTKSPLRDIKEVPSGINIKRFELTKKVPWNWLACRNLGAKVSKSGWLLLTDMDHLVSVKNMNRIVHIIKGRRVKSDWLYLFTRQDAPNLTHYKPHNDSYLMTRSLYWSIGGYDEELAGHYGTSGRYRIRAYERSNGQKRLKIPLIRYPREVIPDASTTEFPRKGEGRDPKVISRIINQKAKEGRENEIRTVSFPYREIK